MNAFTIHQPWAWAIAHAGKCYENRGWPPPAWAIGHPLAIHASKVCDEFDAASLERDLGITIPRPLATGAVVAVAMLAGWTSVEPECRLPGGGFVANLPEAWWSGPIGWILDDVVALPSPVPCRGLQKLWRLPEDVAAEVSHQWGKAP